MASMQGGQLPADANPSPINFSRVLQGVLFNSQLRDLTPFLLRKYQKKEQVTMDEMLLTVDQSYHQHFLGMFREYCESINLGFGIEIRQADPFGKVYDLVPILGLTYSGILDEEENIVSKVDILIFILTLIFLEGNCVSEEKLRKQLARWEMLAHKENISFREPWRFIVEDLVWTEYLSYRQVPNSDPARFEFLWGRRTLAETSKMKILLHAAKLNSEDPKAYPELYEEALDEERRAASARE